MEEAGELLAFYIDDELWYCFNLLQCVDAVDVNKTVYEYDDSNIKTGLKEIAFNTDKLPKSSLFKIPTDNYTTIYCADRRDSDEDGLNNFFCAVAAHAYTGERFEAVFDG